MFRKEQSPTLSHQHTNFKVAYTFSSLKEWADIQFAPKRHGFKLAACQKEAPGQLIVFAPQSHLELDPWTVKAQIIVSENGCNCLGWDPDGKLFALSLLIYIFLDSLNYGMIVVGSNINEEEIKEDPSKEETKIQAKKGNNNF